MEVISQSLKNRFTTSITHLISLKIPVAFQTTESAQFSSNAFIFIIYTEVFCCEEENLDVSPGLNLFLRWYCWSNVV